MFFNERCDTIIQILKEKNTATVHFLAKELFVSEPTVRRDLKNLELQGLIKRTFGGAVLCEYLNKEIPLSMREYENINAKDFIAKKAAKYICNGQVIFLDASSTASRIVKYLSPYSNLTVITNSPKTSMQLAKLNIRTFCTGGLLLENSIAYIGTHAQNFIKNFNADIFFFSSRAITADGIITDSSVEETDLRRTMLANSKKNIFLCTSDKVGRQFFYTLTHASNIDHIICDKEIVFNSSNNTANKFF